MLLLFPPSTHSVYAHRVAITRYPLVVCSISLFKLCSLLFLPMNLLYPSFSFLFLLQSPSVGTFLSAASHSNFCSTSFSSCSISRRLDPAPIKKKQASKNTLGQDFNDSCLFPFRSNRKKKDKRHNNTEKLHFFFF